MKGESLNYPGIALTVLLLLFGSIAAAMLAPFASALLWAAVLSILTFPVYKAWLRRLANVPRLNAETKASIAALITTLFTLVIFLIPFLAIGGGLYLQFAGLVRGLSDQTFDEILAGVEKSIQPTLAQFGATDFHLTGYLNEHRTELLGSLRQPLTNVVGQASVTFFTLTAALLTQYFMLKDGQHLRKSVVALAGLPEARTLEILQRVAETVRAVFVGTVLVAIVQGAVIGVAYAWAGVPNALLLAVVSAILCVIPLLGAPVVYLPVGLALLAQGNVPGAIKVLLVGFLVVSQIDNVLKPFFIGGRTNLHPMAIFFAIIGGVFLVGPIGVMAGPMALTIFLALVTILEEKIAKPAMNRDIDALEGGEAV